MNKDQCKANDYCFFFFDFWLTEPTFYLRRTWNHYRQTTLLAYKLLLCKVYRKISTGVNLITEACYKQRAKGRG